MNAFSIRFAGLVLIVTLADVCSAQAQVVTERDYNPYTGYGGREVATYNPYTGTRTEGQESVNRYTGTRDVSRTETNPYTGASATVNRTYNPYTGRSTVHASYRR